MQTKKNKPKQGEGKKESQNPEKSMFIAIYTKSQGSGGCLPGNRVYVDRDCGVGVYVCMYVCVCMHSLCKSILHRMGV